LWKAAIFAATPTVAPSSSATSTGATLAANLAGGTAPFTYAWSGTGLTFSNSAVANPTATVAAAGTYTASLTVTDANSATASGSTSFTVTQTATTVTVSPSSASLANLATQTFSAAVADQFGNAIASPTVAWSYTPGGAVNSSTGVVTQGGGTVTATSGGHTGTATVLPGGTGTYPAASKVLTTAGTFGPNGTDFTPTYNATPPGVISDLAVSVNGSLLAAFTWSASATATGYYVFSRRDTGGFSPYATPGGVPITDTTFSAPLAAGHDYVFQVQAINASGVISYSFPIAYSTKPADVIPAAGTIYTGTPFGLGGTQTGTLTLPSASNVLSAAPAFGVGGNSSAGTWVSATTANVRSGTFFGAGGTSLTGTLDLPATTNVRTGIVYDNGSKTGTLSAGGTYTAAVNVLAGVDRGDGTFGTLTLASASNVLNTAPTFGVGGTSVLGTYVAPSGSNVRNGLAYGASGTGAGRDARRAPSAVRLHRHRGGQHDRDAHTPQRGERVAGGNVRDRRNVGHRHRDGGRRWNGQRHLSGKPQHGSRWEPEPRRAARDERRWRRHPRRGHHRIFEQRIQPRRLHRSRANDHRSIRPVECPPHAQPRHGLHPCVYQGRQFQPGHGDGRFAVSA
jgi:hypothetical protein